MKPIEEYNLKILKILKTFLEPFEELYQTIRKTFQYVHVTVNINIFKSFEFKTS